VVADEFSQGYSHRKRQRLQFLNRNRCAPREFLRDTALGPLQEIRNVLLAEMLGGHLIADPPTHPLVQV